MIGELYSVVIDAPDPHALATFYAELLGEAVAAALPSLSGPAWVAAIDDDLADTAAFTDASGGTP